MAPDDADGVAFLWGHGTQHHLIYKTQHVTVNPSTAAGFVNLGPGALGGQQHWPQCAITTMQSQQLQPSFWHQHQPFLQQEQLMRPQPMAHSMLSTQQQAMLSMLSSAQQHAVQPLTSVAANCIGSSAPRSMGLPSAGPTSMLPGAPGFNYPHSLTAGWPAGQTPATVVQPATSTLSAPHMYQTQQLQLLQMASAATCSSKHSTGVAAADGGRAAGCQLTKTKTSSTSSMDGTGKGLTKSGAASRRYR